MRALLCVWLLCATSCEDTRRARDRDDDRRERRASVTVAAKPAIARCAGPECLPDVTFVDLAQRSYRGSEVPRGSATKKRD